MYRARAMRLLFEPEYQYSDSLACGLQNIGWRKKANTPTKSTIQHWVIPNPTSGNVLLQLSDGVKEDTECKVYDIQGRVLFVIPVSAGGSQVHLSLKELSAGVYYYSLFTEGKQLEGKIILIK
ncbi:MAG: T9SS type A sorting domain-containing protein [Bacteroidia bacterium]|nr:T9SS type A sorting domain-containing protein [Bacteroidia bacterium]